jgi:hypothetical protein
MVQKVKNSYSMTNHTFNTVKPAYFLFYHILLVISYLNINFNVFYVQALYLSTVSTMYRFKDLFILSYRSICISLILKPYLITFLHFLFTLSLIYVFNFNIVYAMKAEDEFNLNLILNNITNLEERRALILNYLSNITDPIQIRALRDLIDGYARENNLDSLPFTDTQSLNVASSGNLPSDNRQSLTLTQILQRLAVFIGFTALAYLLWRNAGSIRDFFFDLSARAGDNVPNVNDLIRQTRHIFNTTSPDQTDQFISILTAFINNTNRIHQARSGG